MYEYIKNNHPVVAGLLLDQEFLATAEEYIGSKISLSPIVFSLSGENSLIDILDNPLELVNRSTMKLKEVIDIVGTSDNIEPIETDNTRYRIVSDILTPISGRFHWSGRRLYVDGTVHIIAYAYPKIFMANVWSDTMLTLTIPFAYMMYYRQHEALDVASLYETILNRLINFYNKNRVKPIINVIQSIGETKPYAL